MDAYMNETLYEFNKKYINYHMSEHVYKNKSVKFKENGFVAR